MLQNLSEHAIGMLNAGMTMNNVMYIGCSIRAIPHLRQCFQATGHTEGQPRSGHTRFMTHCQDRYFLNTHLSNSFKLPQLLILTPMVHNNHISA